MAVTCISIKSLCFPNLFFICLFMFSSTAIPRCERRLEVQDQVAVNSSDGCLEEENEIRDDPYTTLVSPNKEFECGFFSPENNTKNGRYLGIWYYEQNPKTVVWVANRDKPLLGSNGYLILKKGTAMLLDMKNGTYWLASGGSVQVDSTNLCLHDNGNLVLKDRSRFRTGNPILWQSFDHPTDTLLPGMTEGGSFDLSFTSLSLTSWKNQNNTAKGNFTFPLKLNNKDLKLHITKNGNPDYWQSEVTLFDKLPPALSLLWFNNNNIPLPNNTRLVMSFTGQLQFWTFGNEKGWSLNWSEPKDGCSMYDNRCGNFGSCSSNNGWSCKCLPGFKPYSEDTSKGCRQKSDLLLCERNDFSSDEFLKLPKMKLGNLTCSVPASTDGGCRAQCRNDCQCVAYSTDFAHCSLAPNSEKGCLIWKDVLTNLQEDFLHGITIFVRAKTFDIDNTSRGCWPCGTYIIPYPLSTGRDCGDSKYSNFYCNEKTGQVYFSNPSRNIRVTSIDPDANSFNITIMHASCDNSSSVLSLNPSSPFIPKGCELIKDQPFTETQQPFIEVEIGWKPPQEFSCNVSSDCKLWPHTSCKRTKEGEMRCICGSKFHWNGKTLNCMRVHFPRKYVVLCSAGALAIFLGGIAFLVYLMRKRRMARGKGLLELKEDDTEGIDVPFFDWDNILAATNNFADANRLGTGGFGSVYMGKLSDGKVIAVKRLSSVSVQGVEEFRTEVLLIAKLQHRNLVKLLGYCMKGDEKILVYEFMSNGSLDSCLFDEQHSVYLDWKKRFEIILGIARGLLYLHQDSRLRIIHRDLKPSNILLDEELNPKISDFGIARIVGGKETQASTGRVVGTYGYMSPEYASDGIFSVKSDVFSFGVVILETVSGRRNSRIYMFEHGLSLLGHAWKLWNEEKGLEIMDSKLNESCLLTEVQKCIHIGLLCVQEDPSDRPTMSTVVYMLSGENAPLPPAKQPAFMNRKPLSESASSSSVKDLSMQQEMMTVSTVGR